MKLLHISSVVAMWSAWAFSDLGLIPIDLSGLCVLAWFVGTSLILKRAAPLPATP